jgi:hypothetical protein
MASVNAQAGMNRRHKLLASALVVGVLGTVAAGGVFGLFSATTQNSGNEISTGIVALSDNDNGSAMFNVSNAKPGDTWTRCIKVTYGGTLPADVHLYLKEGLGPLGHHLSMRMRQGTQLNSTFPSCTGFAPDGSAGGTGIAFVGPIATDPPSPPGTFEGGLPLAPFGQEAWTTGTSQVYEFEMTLAASTPDTMQGSSTGSLTVVWEARNH